MGRPDPFDGLHHVPDSQEWVDEQLRNWQAWLRGGSLTGATSPMFRLYRSQGQREYGASAAPAAREAEALRVERAVSLMPPMHGEVLRWYYWRGGSPFKAAKDCGVTQWQLVSLLRDARARIEVTLRAAEAIERAKSAKNHLLFQNPSR